MTDQRKAHMLNPTRGRERPGQVIFFDTETSQVVHDENVTTHILKLGVVQHYRTVRGESLALQSERVFTSIPEFWDYVARCIRSKSTAYLVAHNIVFDLSVLNGFTSLAKMGWSLDGFYSKGVVSIFRWRKGERHLIAIDNSNLFAGKLAKWGEIFKMPKLEVDFSTAGLGQLTVYCRRDVEIMVKCWRSWLEFLDAHDLGSFKPTVGASAFSAWRRRFMPAKVHIHADKLALQLERESFRGGRVECLYQGWIEGGSFHYLDINNMYGHVLSRYEFPAGLWDAAETDSLSMLIRKLGQYAVIARVDLEVDQNWVPFMHAGHTCYPLGSFTTTLTTPELMLAYERGWLRGVSALAWYRQEPLFASYVKYFGDLRRRYADQGNEGYAAISKLLVNSLYGKFGQLALKQTCIGEVPLSEVWSQSVKDIVTNEIYRMIAVGGKVFEERRNGESANSFPGIAAHVTAFARLYLNRMRMMVDPGHVFYMDTDSLIVDDWGRDQLAHLFDPRRIGALKIELSSPWVEINAPKDYRMLDRVRLKGIKVSAEEIAPGQFKQDQWERFAGKVLHGQMDGYNVRSIVKRQKRVIHSGAVLPSGWIAPFVLQAGEAVEVAPLALPPAPILQPSGSSELER